MSVCKKSWSLQASLCRLLTGFNLWEEPMENWQIGRKEKIVSFLSSLLQAFPDLAPILSTAPALSRIFQSPLHSPAFPYPLPVTINLYTASHASLTLFLLWPASGLSWMYPASILSQWFSVYHNLQRGGRFTKSTSTTKCENWSTFQVM